MKSGRGTDPTEPCELLLFFFLNARILHYVLKLHKLQSSLRLYHEAALIPTRCRSEPILMRAIGDQADPDPQRPMGDQLRGAFLPTPFHGLVDAVDLLRAIMAGETEGHQVLTLKVALVAMIAWLAIYSFCQ